MLGRAFNHSQRINRLRAKVANGDRQIDVYFTRIFGIDDIVRIFQFPSSHT
jgi:hypothetical protein